MSIAIVLGVVVVAMVLFAVERIPIEVSSLAVVCILALTQVLTPQQAFHGFSNDTVIFIFTLLAMTQGLASTGLMHLIGQRLAFFGRFGQRSFLLAMMTVVAAISSLVSNTVTAAAFLPVAMGAARRAKLPNSKVLIPLAYASMLGGPILLFGTSTNLVVSAEMKELGMQGLGVTELTRLGLPIAIAGIFIVVLLAPLLLPVREEGSAAAYDLREYLTEAVVTPGSRYLGKRLSEITEGLGLRVLGVVRDGAVLPPGPTLQLSLQDRLIVEGNRHDVLQIKDLRGIELKADHQLSDAELRPEELILIEAAVPPGSPLVHRTLKGTLFGHRYGLIALAIHRGPAIQRLTKLKLLQQSTDEISLASLRLSVGDVLLLRGPRARVASLAESNALTVLTDVEYQPPRHRKVALAVIIFLTSLALGSLGLLPLSVAGLSGMLAMIATGCVDARLAFRVNWRVVLLIGSMMALGMAMEKSGAGHFLGGLLASLSDQLGPRGVLVLLMVLTIVLSTPMSNQAAALVVLPVAVSTALTLGVDSRPFAIGVCLAASVSFITPFEPACMLVYGPGRYRFTDFFRLGLPLTVALLALLAFAVPRAWPF